MVDLHEPNAPDAEPAPLPESPDGAAETPDPSTEPADGGPSDSDGDGPLRDPATGRFAPKGPQDPAPDAPPAGDGSAAEDPDAPADPPAEPDAAPTATDAAPPGAPAEQPFAFPHRGQMHAVEGAVVRPDGALVIPAASRQRVEMLLTRGREHEVGYPQREQQWRREVETLKQQADARHAGVEAFSALFADGPDAETFLARALAFYENLPKLREEMTRAELEARDRRIAELEGRAPAAPNGQAPNTGPTPEAIQQEVGATVREGLGLARTAIPEFKDFTDAELQAIAPKLHQRAGLFIRVATADDEARYGAERAAVGSLVFDEDAFVEELKLLAGPTIQAKRQAAAKAQADAARAEAAKRNGKVLTPTKTPPVPRPGGGAPVGGADAEFDDMDGFKRWAATG